MKKKPSELLEAFFEANLERYKEFGTTDQAIATLLNMINSQMGVSGILDGIEERLSKMEGRNRKG